jgi:PIN domain nuclease of toxin-antitoxin system
VKYLLDTHTLLWWAFDAPDLSPAARALISDPANTILVSSASAWEMATKHRLGRLPEASVFLQDLVGWLDKAGLVELPIGLVHAQRAGAMPQPHRDPFDRMISAQSLLEQAPVIGCDEALRQFGVALVW